jgi:hypothetical protein
MKVSAFWILRPVFTWKQTTFQRCLLFILVVWECVTELRPPTGSLLRWYMSKEGYGGMVLTGQTRWSWTHACPSATISTINPTWTDPGANPGLRSEKSATKPWGMARPSDVRTALLSPEDGGCKHFWNVSVFPSGDYGNKRLWNVGILPQD